MAFEEVVIDDDKAGPVGRRSIVGPDDVGSDCIVDYFDFPLLFELHRGGRDYVPLIRRGLEPVVTG